MTVTVVAMKLVTPFFALLVAAGLVCLGLSGSAASDEGRGAAVSLWQFEGHAALLPAADKAKTERRRLLLGLSGGAT
jgi:hypothetical protein